MRPKFNFRYLILLLLVLALLFITIDLTKSYHDKECPIYENSNKENDKNNPPIKTVFGKMFKKPSPWLNAVHDSDVRHLPDVNVRQNA